MFLMTRDGAGKLTFHTPSGLQYFFRQFRVPLIDSYDIQHAIGRLSSEITGTWLVKSGQCHTDRVCHNQGTHNSMGHERGVLTGKRGFVQSNHLSLSRLIFCVYLATIFKGVMVNVSLMHWFLPVIIIYHQSN